MASVLDTLLSTFSAYLLSSLTSLLKMIVLFLIFTIIIATITLIERKVLALLQRRVGPNYIGYKGRLQFIADAFKMLLKHIAVINRTNRLLFIVIPAFILIISYLFWANLVWSPNLAICEIEYNVLFLCVTSTGFSYLLIVVGFVSGNKYSMISSLRTIGMGLVIEILLTFLLILLAMVSSSLNFVQIASLQSNFKWNFFYFLPALPLVCVTFFLETARIPFDLAEAEAELIAGYTTEFGGFYFALFYLGEYFHLFCFSTAYALIFFGGWN